MMRRLGLTTLGLLAGTEAAAQEPFDVRAHYTKQEVMIPMRDGIRLFTSILLPRDSTVRHPVLLSRTPYSCAPYGPDAIARGFPNQQARYLRAGYILVCQDVRGRYLSEGDFANVRPYKPVKQGPTDIDETTDTYDTVEWLVRNLRTGNGNVGISGISYPGFYAWMGTIDAHPAVKATSPQAPVTKWMGGDDFFHNGAFLLPHAFDFYSWFGWPRPAPKSTQDPQFDQGTPDEYAFFLRMGAVANANAKYLKHGVAFWDTITANGQWNAYWAARDVHPHLKNLRPATLVVGGWFDTENLFGALRSYETNERQSPKAANRLVMGPWFHGGWNFHPRGDSLGDMAWGSATAVFYTDSIEGPFFDYYLKGEGMLTLPEAFVFNTGANVWRRLDAWPPPGTMTQKFVLAGGGRLLGGSDGKDGNDGSEYDEYIHDPSRPVPYSNRIGRWYDPGFMVEDQRFAARRPDVLVYETEPLSEDVTLAGPIDVRFTVSTSGTDADWIVKVIDVFPDTAGRAGPGADWFQGPGAVQLGGYQMLVRGDVLRGKFRNSLEKPEPFVPDQATPIGFRLNDVFHTFKRGHRIMVQVQSSWFPMVDRNPGVFLDIFQAKDADFRATTQRVYHSAAHPSWIEVRVLR